MKKIPQLGETRVRSDRPYDAQIMVDEPGAQGNKPGMGGLDCS